jgi:predicted nicotinamide N-methyase
VSFTYEWLDCSVAFGEQSFRIRSAASFSTGDRARGRAALPFGSVLWPAAIVLGDALVRDPELVRGKCVVELGCGLGLGAIVATKLGAAEVLATDNHTDMPQMYEHNARLNDVTPRYRHYDWATQEDFGVFDVVLASDVLYELSACTLLADAIDRTLSSSGLAIVSDPGRPHWPRFLKKLQARNLRYDDRRAHLPKSTDTGLDRVLTMHPTAKRHHHLLFIRRAAPQNV